MRRAYSRERAAPRRKMGEGWTREGPRKRAERRRGPWLSSQARSDARAPFALFAPSPTFSARGASES